MNDLTKAHAHIDIDSHPNFIRLRCEEGFDWLDEDNIDTFLAYPGLKMAVFADDPNARKETMDIVVIAPELKKAFAGTLSVTAFARPHTARAIAARWGLRSMPAVAIFRHKDFLGAVQGLQSWNDYCQKIAEIVQKQQSAPRIIALKSEVAEL